MLVIDAQTGTILNVEQCFIVDDSKLNDKGRELLESGNDSDVSLVAQAFGTSLLEIGQDTGWGDNKYRYSVSYSPLSIRDEAQAWIDGGVIDQGDNLYDPLMWIINDATDEELGAISYRIVTDDGVWDQFRRRLSDNILEAWEERLDEIGSRND